MPMVGIAFSLFRLPDRKTGSGQWRAYASRGDYILITFSA